MLQSDWIANFYENEKIIKNFKKNVDQTLFRWYSITCPWDKGKRATQTQKKTSKKCWQRKTALIK